MMATLLSEAGRQSAHFGKPIQPLVQVGKTCFPHLHEPLTIHLTYHADGVVHFNFRAPGSLSTATPESSPVVTSRL